MFSKPTKLKIIVKKDCFIVYKHYTIILHFIVKFIQYSLLL